MTDTLTKAKELIEKFEGKITHGEWCINPYLDCIASKHSNADENYDEDYIDLHELDVELMLKSPTMLTIIKELVIEYLLVKIELEKPIYSLWKHEINKNKELKNTIQKRWYDYKKITDENQVLKDENSNLKQRLAELEGKG